METDPFNRVSQPESIVLHVGKERFPHEALCGKILCDTPAKSGKGKRKCENCQKSLRSAV